MACQVPVTARNPGFSHHAGTASAHSHAGLICSDLRSGWASAESHLNALTLRPVPAYVCAVACAVYPVSACLCLAACSAAQRSPAAGCWRCAQRSVRLRWLAPAPSWSDGWHDTWSMCPTSAAASVYDAPRTCPHPLPLPVPSRCSRRRRRLPRDGSAQRWLSCDWALVAPSSSHQAHYC